MHPCAEGVAYRAYRPDAASLRVRMSASAKSGWRCG